MEKWEEEGFASEEAYNKYRQTIENLENDKKKAEEQVLEKQKVIDSNRTKISDLSEVSKERDALKEKVAELESGKKNDEHLVQPKEKTPEEIKAANEKRINDLSENQRTKLIEAYDKADQDKKKLLDTPQGMEVFLDLMLKDEEPNSNPFAVKKKENKKDLTTQVAEAFGLIDTRNKGPLTKERKGTGFDITISETVKKGQDDMTKKVEAARQRLLA